MIATIVGNPAVASTAATGTPRNSAASADARLSNSWRDTDSPDAVTVRGVSSASCKAVSKRMHRSSQSP
ncbi:hypothetical protein Ahu01nite_019130 [Winogradskya humida]|uniref:Uncharacterized protein n=1 Tax=Winogradskya humida TaxID=113566 RepID=A0ABQ3ZJP6_9ACTN|nr:hypothetical protein Ahu01nite_019130 [Actinoplanes humidus]